MSSRAASTATSRAPAERVPTAGLVHVTAMVPQPGESPGEWWENTGYPEAVRVPRELAEEALGKEREHPSSAAMAAPWPLDAWPDVPTSFVLCSKDRFFPPDFFRRLAADRLGIVPDEIEASHSATLSHPEDWRSCWRAMRSRPCHDPHQQSVSATATQAVRIAALSQDRRRSRSGSRRLGSGGHPARLGRAVAAGLDVEACRAAVVRLLGVHLSPAERARQVEGHSPSMPR